MACRGHARSLEATQAKLSLSVLSPSRSHSPRLCGPGAGLGASSRKGHGLSQFAQATESLPAYFGSGASNVRSEVIFFFPHLILT